MRSVVLGCGNAASLENVSCVRKCCMRQKKCCMHQKMLYASANAVCVRKMLYASANAVCVSKCCMRQRMQHASEKCCRCVLCRVGQNHTFIGIYGIFGREITILTVICGADIRFWPTLVLCNMHK